MVALQMPYSLPLRLLVSVALCMVVESFAQEPTWAFSLTTPVQGAVLRSGEMVPVSVAVGKDVNLRSVKYLLVSCR